MAKSRRGRGGAESVVETVDGGVAELRPDRDRPRARTLLIDGAPQSFVDLDAPEYLDFSYQRRLGHAVDLVVPPGKPLRAVHLGGGALTLARYVAATRPRSTQQVVEIDAPLVQLVRRELPLESGWRIRVRAGDAREALAKVPDGWADLIIADVFRGARTPAHLTSTEFVTDVRRALADGGWYAANIADGPPLRFLRPTTANTAIRSSTPSSTRRTPPPTRRRPSRNSRTPNGSSPRTCRPFRSGTRTATAATPTGSPMWR
ncbi:spermidine synthase [Streptomyces sp. NPDC002067]